ncbi:hypothetical protein [Leptolyngbya sp. 7M]|uniref:hypothetical protein n=1 Tax=Leptolyngbya sp. 7M TaxID=2812896 RepID=UPI001B8A8E85|nr:hypothetical protein [Leptolyngbya sp. 7M]QYO63131.1 hypothetical protein JVX88_24685 [Leptolyngbya sp. 7M]
MWTKTYIATAVTFCLFLGFVVYYSSSWLGSITAPADAFAGYEYYRGLSWYILAFTSIVLLILANVIFAKRGKSWAMWTTLGYFCLFLVAIGFVLPIASISFLRGHGYSAELRSYFSPFIAVAFMAAAAALIYGNRYLAGRLRDRIHGRSSAEEASDEETVATSPN